jgi:hypothetical protein
MSPLLCAGKRLAALSLMVAALGSTFAQAGYAPTGVEYMLAGGLPGDQAHPAVSLNSSGGFVVWDDNSTDGDGLGISARRLDQTFSGVFGAFRVNQQGVGNQEKPRVALLPDGGAVFVWQGGAPGAQRIYARFVKADGTFGTGDIRVNTYVKAQQIKPDAAVLANGEVLVTWSSLDQDGSRLGVYAQRLSSAGVKIGGEFRVSVTTAYNQRDAAVVGLAAGGCVVVWINESGSDTVGDFSVDIVGRLLDQPGAGTNEFRINTGTNVCANPAVSASAEGGFLVAWGQLDPKVTETATNHWDVYARAFNGIGQARGADFRVNTYLYGDQYAPRIAGRTDHLVVWTSMGQDGSREGVFGQFVSSDGTPIGGEIQANTTTVSRQIDPVVAALDSDRFLVAWSGFIGGVPSFDLFAQRYESTTQPITPPAAPYVTALDSSSLSVTWPDMSGLNVEHFELFINGATTPVRVTGGSYLLSGLTPHSTNAFELLYQLADGRRSAKSAVATGVTWGVDANFDGVPDDWEAKYFGPDPSQWPSPGADSDGDGVKNLQEFLAGTDPTDAASVLRAELEVTEQGTRLVWNSQPGLVYQVQSSGDLRAWSNLGASRFARGTTDSLLVNGGDPATYYRVNRLR